MNKNCKNCKKVYYVRFLTEKVESTISPETFQKNVLHVLNSKESWGYKVVRGEPADVVIGIAPSRDYYRYIKGKKVYFSVTFYKENPPLILFDPHNYQYGVKESGLSVKNYRKYLINHEFAHALGKDHLKCYPGKTCPVLYQMTKGLPPKSKPNYKVTPRDRASRNLLE